MAGGNQSQNYRSTDYARADNDWYVEPIWCVEALADALEFPGNIWDPCCGSGTIPSIFAKRGFTVHGTDIVERWKHQSGFWDATQSGTPDCIKPGIRLNVVTNPPFKMAETITRRMLPLIDYRLAVLQQLSFLASKARHSLFTEFLPSDVLILSRRPSMPPGHLIEEMGDKAFKGGTTDFCWIVWTKPHDRETRVRWLYPEAV